MRLLRLIDLQKGRRLPTDIEREMEFEELQRALRTERERANAERERTAELEAELTCLRAAQKSDGPRI